ncbi:MAG TPA: hypothetical protein VK535_14045 [Gemmatimonadales bacterium]|nr:hypothetical protein [Gemmatimonadales bacterium]
MNRRTRVFSIVAGVLAATLIAACSDEATAPSAPALAVAGTTRPPTITPCTQPYGAASVWIGPNGGRVKAGGHILNVPAGALKAATLITMETPSGNIGHVVFGPEGLTFNSDYPAHLVMGYQNCVVAPNAIQQVAYTSATLNILETQPSVSDPATLTVDAKLTHFSDYVIVSTYAVAY